MRAENEVNKCIHICSRLGTTHMRVFHVTIHQWE
jgi:hypothetical protein